MMASQPLDLTSFLNQEFFFSELDGLIHNTGIPTPTTPTITPTSNLRSINEEDISFDTFHSDVHVFEAKFEPPVIPPSRSTSVSQANGSTYFANTKSWQGGSATVASLALAATNNNTILQSLPQHQDIPISRYNTVQHDPPSPPPPPPKKGGRRPIKEQGISPEEEERRDLRRKRNKEAAARCRKRRMDHTNELLEETKALEDKKREIQEEIKLLTTQKQNIEISLVAHKTCCRLLGTDSLADDMEDDDDDSFLNANPSLCSSADQVTFNGVTISIKSEPISDIPTSSSSLVNSNKRVAIEGTNHSHNRPRQRPTSLAVPQTTFPQHKPQQNHNLRNGGSTLISEIAGVPISTPSTGIPFNFESLMEGGTGLTPVSGPLVPTCSSQQRSSFSSNNNMSSSLNCDLTSPDTVNSKLVSL